MIKEQTKIIFPFQYTTKPAASLCQTINPDELYNLLPYVKNFFDNESTKKISILPIEIPTLYSLCYKPSLEHFAKHIEIVAFQQAQIYFFDKNIAILVITLKAFTDQEKVSSSKIIKILTDVSNYNRAIMVNKSPKDIYTTIPITTNYDKPVYIGQVKIFTDKKNNCTIVSDFRIPDNFDLVDNDINAALHTNEKRFYDHLSQSETVREWIQNLLQPYIHDFDHANFLNLSKLLFYSIILTENGFCPLMEKYTESLLFGHTYEHSTSAESFQFALKPHKYSSKVNVFSNLNGVVIIGLDQENQYMRSSYFDQFGKNIFLIYVFVLLQKSRLVQLITDADKVSLNDNQPYFKDALIEFLTYINFTQLSNNPARNEIYKFFRTTNLIDDLLKETTILTKFFSRKEEISSQHREARRTLILEIILGVIGFLVSIASIFNDEIKEFLLNLIK